jgi:hypothetical protein
LLFTPTPLLRSRDAFDMCPSMGPGAGILAVYT